MAKSADCIVVYWNGFNKKIRFSDALVDTFSETVAAKHANNVVAKGAVRAEIQDVDGKLMSRYERTRDGGSLQTYSARKDAAKTPKPSNDTSDNPKSGRGKRSKAGPDDTG